MIFQVIAFAVVTDLYRKNSYPGFEQARPGTSLSARSSRNQVADLGWYRYRIRPQHRVVDSWCARHLRHRHHRHICQQGPQMGCRQQGIPPHRRLMSRSDAPPSCIDTWMFPCYSTATPTTELFLSPFTIAVCSLSAPFVDISRLPITLYLTRISMPNERS